MRWQWTVFAMHCCLAVIALYGATIKPDPIDRVGLAVTFVLVLVFAWFWLMDALEGDQ